MTNQQNNQPTTRPGKARTNATVVPVFLASAAIFTLLAGLLGVQVANGQDPLLGAKKPEVVQKSLILRKVIKTKKIVTIVEAPSGSSAASGSSPTYASSGGGGGTSYSAPAQTYSAPVQSAPAPVQTAAS
ncbi:MAG: hypothetical protein NWQ82_04535 [Solirubrobacteraceae bacterium]|jgi:uncharacterized membrane protein YgcG|nr:hypothetical protein [Solirubrobacteraceae bacterium]